MDKIRPNITKKELNKFLKQKYGYRYNEFAESFILIHAFYITQDHIRSEKHIDKRKAELERLKEKLVELIDSFLIQTNFYNCSKHPKILGKEYLIWTPTKKRDFIIKNFELDSFIYVIDKLVKFLQKSPFLPHPLKKAVNRNIYLKPGNLLILVWAFALKRKGRIEWTNMEKLLIWFSKELDKIGMSFYFGVDKESVPSSERLKFIYNKYKKTDIIKIAEAIYISSFQDKSIKKSKIDPLTRMNDYLNDEKPSLSWENMIDLSLAFAIAKGKKFL